LVLPHATTFDDFRVDLEDVTHADDERVVVEIRDGGHMKGSDAEVWNRYFDVWTFQGGRPFACPCIPTGREPLKLPDCRIRSRSCSARNGGVVH
jgi:hypothetical protein